MPWIVGIDEAGYGPNLGPLVMSSVAYWVPHDHRTDIWQLLSGAVRRPSEQTDDERLVVGDSKQVYSPSSGLRSLERSIWGVALGRYIETQTATTLSWLLDQVSPAHVAALCSECWYRGDTPLPTAMEETDRVTGATLFADASSGAGVRWSDVRSVIVCAPRFNELLDRWDTKAVVLGFGFAELVKAHRTLGCDDDAIHVFVDKHGGRNYYGDMLQEAFDDCMVIAREESRRRSTYEVLGAERPFEVTFEPEADGSHFSVALASMLSKYLRELLMHEFNGFWQQHIPGLKPTAGYPGDSRRFYRAIEKTVQRLGVSEHQIWRRR